MSNSFVFSLTPEIVPDLVRRSGSAVDNLHASYRCSGEIRSLDIERESTVGFSDPLSVWSVEEYGLILEMNLRIKHPGMFFEGVNVPLRGCVLGTAFRLGSSASRQIAVFDNGNVSITDVSDKVDLPVSFEIPPGRFRKDAVAELILYAKGPPSGDGPRPGTVLGSIYRDKLSFSGEASEFPISTVESKENFLWRLDVDFEDPRCDSFDQCVSLQFNSKHPKYKELGLNSDPFKSTAFLEIMAQSLFVIISEVMTDSGNSNPELVKDIVDNRNLDEGSLGSAVHYMINSYAHSFADPVKLNMELHEFVWGGGEI